MDLFFFLKNRSTKRNNTMFLPRFRPLKGHERSYGPCKMNRITICTELNGRM